MLFHKTRAFSANLRGLSLETKDLSRLAAQTQQIYERNAAEFAAHRPKTLVEKPWLDRFLAGMPEKAHILDLGCGTGDPIAAYFMQKGCQVTGLDASAAMISLARTSFPAGDWRLGDMRTFELPERFHGIIGWCSFFHLTPQEQRHTLSIIAKHLHPEGALLLTVGPQNGEVAGCVGDDPIYHSSLSPHEYARALSDLDLQVLDFVAEDPTCFGMTVLLARKSP